MAGLLGLWLKAMDRLARRWWVARLRADGVKVGPRALVRGRVMVSNGTRISIGSDARIAPGVVLSASSQGRIAIGDHVLINNYVIINSGLEVVIEDWVTIAPFCQIVDGDHGTADPDRPIRQQDENYVQAPVRLGRDAWLGAHAIVVKGVTIGAGAVVGAGSVVTKDVPDRAIAVGVPARVVGWRGEPPADTAGPAAP